VAQTCDSLMELCLDYLVGVGEFWISAVWLLECERKLSQCKRTPSYIKPLY